MIDGKFPDVATSAEVKTWKPAEASAAEGLGFDNADREQQHHRPVARSPTDVRRTSNKPWKNGKVFSDILNHSMLPLSAEQRDQLRALKSFHDMYPTADSMPRLPVCCAAPAFQAETTSSWSMEH
eukprot:965725-Pleurochrysis_carterae.AAC.1